MFQIPHLNLKINMKINGLCVSVVALVLFGCASTPKISESDIKTLLQGPVQINIPAPIALSERTKARAIGNFVASSVAGSVAGSTGNAKTLGQMQANQQIGSQFGTQLNQALPKGVSVTKGGGVNTLLANKLKDEFAEKASANPDLEIQLNVNTRQWELEYVGLLSSDYKLNYNLEVNLVRVQGGKSSVLKSWACMGSAPELKTYEAWIKDDYVAVNNQAAKVSEKCISEFKKSGLL
jgi:hypothetical protein